MYTYTANIFLEFVKTLCQLDSGSLKLSYDVRNW